MNAIKRITLTPEFEFGAYTGMLEAINIHNQNIFYIYPASHLPKLKCSFPENLRTEVIAAIGKYVTVLGEKKFKPSIGDAIPYEMHAREIEVHPDEDELPTLMALKGLAPDITEGKTSEVFIREIRDEW